MHHCLSRKMSSGSFHHLGASGGCWEQDFCKDKYVWKAVVQGHFFLAITESPEPEGAHNLLKMDAVYT